MPKLENPFIDPKFFQKLKEEGIEEGTILTHLQSFAFPVLMWLFEPRAGIRTGRTYLMAVVCLELAKSGHTVYLNDYTVWPTMGERLNTKRYFIDVVMEIMKNHYKRDIFEYRQNDSSLVYKGRRRK